MLRVMHCRPQKDGNQRSWLRTTKTPTGTLKMFHHLPSLRTGGGSPPPQYENVSAQLFMRFACQLGMSLSIYY